MKYKIKKVVEKYVQNGKLEKLLYKFNDKVMEKRGKDYSSYINKFIIKLKK
ncbi:hypothetical protein [Staphylococcus shinii]|uniref:hypothetical protein n=1 Tax=Staphylococcus shinii TaxID=2912228 RepID=UPI003F55A0D9